MKFRTKCRALFPTRTQWVHPWSQRLFLVMGTLLLSYCGFVLLDTRFYQAYLKETFQQALKNSRLPAGGDELYSPSSAGANRRGVVSRGSAGRGSSALGQLEISRIGLEAMILEGDDGKALRLGIGHIAGSTLPGEQGNVVLAGHRDTFFRPLRKIRKGDEITVTTLYGKYRYLVESIQVVSPGDVGVMDASIRPTLTLVTCYPFYFVGPAPRRFVVKARWIPG